MDLATIDHVLHDNEVDSVSGVPFAAIIFMLYYGMELNHFLLDISHDFIKKMPLKQYHVGTSSTYLSGSAAEGLYLNTKWLPHARDIDIVTIWRKYPIREKCHYEDFSVEEWLLKSKSEREEGCVCASNIKMNMTANECDDRYLNIKVLPETPPGYVLLQKCRRHPALVQTLDDILVSSLKTTEARMDYWYDIRDNLKQRFKPGEHYVDEDGVHEEGPLFDFITSHGPAVTATMAGPGLFGSCVLFEGIDIVFAVLYPLPWPDIAKEWISRKRPSGWPSQKLVDEVIADGCTLVPKGSTGSALEDYEWRISFTGELRLARSLSLVKRQLLHVLKALVAEPQNDLEMKAIDIDLTEKIESFQFLNLMFRESEILDEHEWNSKNFAHMLFYLIDRYLEHFEQGHLSHYIIKTRNIFEKFKSFSVEDKDALLYTLHRIKMKPLEQILQQERYIRLKPRSHKQVFAPFVEEVKRKGTVSQKLYVNTLVSLVRANLFEKSYSSAYIYGMDALRFYQSMSDDTMSDQEYMDLFFTTALSCHRVGRSERVLEFLEKLHVVMTGQSEESLAETFGARNYAELLVLFARTLIVNAHKGSQYIVKDKVVQHALKLYNDALKLDPSNVQIMIDLVNIQMQFGDKQQVENLISEILYKFPEFETVISQSTDNNGQSELKNTALNDAEVIYDREAFANDQTNIDVEANDTSQFDYLFCRCESKFEQEPPEFNVQTVDNDERGILSDESVTEVVDQAIPVHNQDSEHTKKETNLPKEVVDDDLDEEHRQNQEEFTEYDLYKIDRKLMRDYYQMKAFEEINMKHKVEIIRNRLEIKMQGERQKGIKVSFAMLESLYKLYESSFRWKTDLDTDTMSTEIISDYDMHVIYSTADTLLLDDRLVSLFALFDSTVIRVPVKVLFLHLFIQFSKLQGNFDQAQGVLQQMKYTVKTLHHAFDFAIGEFLLASHIQWFGNADLPNEFHSNAKETILKSKDTVDPPSIKHRIFNWIHQVLSTIAVNEPYNKYLDDIFAV